MGCFDFYHEDFVMSVHSYNMAVSTLNGMICPQRLGLEIEAVLNLEASVDMSMAMADIIFLETLTAEQVLTLTGVLAAHGGMAIPYVKFLSSAKLVHDEIVINQKTELQIIGGIVSRPAFFVKDLSKSFARVSGEMKVVGAGLQAHVVQVEADGTQTVLTTPIDTAGDESGAWHTFEMFTGAITIEEQATYRFEGMLGDAISASFRFCTLELLETR